MIMDLSANLLAGLLALGWWLSQHPGLVALATAATWAAMWLAMALLAVLVVVALVRGLARLSPDDYQPQRKQQ